MDPLADRDHPEGRHLGLLHGHQGSLSVRRLAALLVLTCVLAVGSGVGAAPARPDLNGLWRTSEGALVVIQQQGTSVSGEFLVPDECPNGGTRTWWIRGSLAGTRLTGTMQGHRQPDARRLGSGGGHRPGPPGDDNPDRIEKVLITTEWMVEEAASPPRPSPGSRSATW